MSATIYRFLWGCKRCASPLRHILAILPQPSMRRLHIGNPAIAEFFGNRGGRSSKRWKCCVRYAFRRGQPQRTFPSACRIRTRATAASWPTLPRRGVLENGSLGPVGADRCGGNLARVGPDHRQAHCSLANLLRSHRRMALRSRCFLHSGQTWQLPSFPTVTFFSRSKCHSSM